MKHLPLLSTMALSALLGCAEPEQTQPLPAQEELQTDVTSALLARAPLYTRSADRLNYGIYANEHGQARLLGSLYVSSRGLTLDTSVAADLSKMALIVDFDGLRGRQLTVFDVKSERFQQVDLAQVASAAWSADGTKLAYSVERGGQCDLRISDGSTQGTTVGTVTGQSLRVLGWSPKADALYIAYSPEVNDEPTHRFARFDLASGAVTDILVGTRRGNFLSDFRLLTLHNGRQVVSFIRSGHVYGCSELPSSLVLASVEGEVLREFGASRERNYLTALWSPDSHHVAYTSVICPPEGERIDLQPLIARETGVFLGDARSGRADRLVEGIPMQNTRIEHVDSQGALLSSAARGLTASPRENTLSSEVLDANRRPNVMLQAAVRNNWAQYIHQYYDTKDGFDGWWACGPTSSVMSIAGYILPQWSVWSSLPYGHSAPYSGWITEVYSWGGTTFDRYYRDAKYRTPGGAGAYGWHMDSSCDCTAWWRLSDWLGKHIGYGEYNSWAGMEQWVRNKLNESAGRLLISAGDPFGRGHIILVKGYNDDGSFIFHDPAGYQRTNGYNGGNVSYWWSEIASRHVWWD